MKPMLLCFASATLCLLLPGPASAGMNAGATAHLYWQVGTGTGSPLYCTQETRPQLLVTVKGLQSFRGADVQLQVRSSNYYSQNSPPVTAPVPQAWQLQSGGCAEGSEAFFKGGRGGAYLNGFTSAPAVPGVAVAFNTMFLTSQMPCPNQVPDVGYLRYEAVGSGGAVRDPSLEYGIVAIQFDLRGMANGGATNCPGDLGNGPVPVTLQALRSACLDPGSPNYLCVAIYDANNNVDYTPVAFSGGKNGLGWLAYGDCFCEAGSAGDWCGCNLYYCGTTAASSMTWGKVRRLYH